MKTKNFCRNTKLVRWGLATIDRLLTVFLVFEQLYKHGTRTVKVRHCRPESISHPEQCLTYSAAVLTFKFFTCPETIETVHTTLL